MKSKRIAAKAMVLTAALLLTRIAWAFNRDLSGMWRAPDSTSVIIVHDPHTDQVTFLFPMAIGDIKRLEFVGTVEDLSEMVGPNQFGIDTKLDPISYDNDHGESCDLTGTFSAQGKVIGQAPGRRLQMLVASRHLVVSCVDKRGTTSRRHLDTGYGGEWR